MLCGVQAAELFSLADLNQDMVLTKSEMKKFAHTAEGMSLKELFDVQSAGWAGMWAAIDSDNDGKFSRQEFVDAYVFAMEAKAEVEMLEQNIGERVTAGMAGGSHTVGPKVVEPAADDYRQLIGVGDTMLYREKEVVTVRKVCEGEDGYFYVIRMQDGTERNAFAQDLSRPSEEELDFDSPEAVRRREQRQKLFAMSDEEILAMAMADCQN